MALSYFLSLAVWPSSVPNPQSCSPKGGGVILEQFSYPVGIQTPSPGRCTWDTEQLCSQKTYLVVPMANVPWVPALQQTLFRGPEMQG